MDPARRRLWAAQVGRADLHHRRAQREGGLDAGPIGDAAGGDHRNADGADDLRQQGEGAALQAQVVVQKVAAMAAGLEGLRQSTAEITNDIHSLSHRLHSSTLDYLGLGPALQKLVSEFPIRHGIAIDFEHRALPAPLPSDVALCLFRVTEESLTNIAKHSHAKSARVHVNGASDGIHLSVEDSGSGFDPDAVERRAGLGFVSMRERLRALRGTVRVNSLPSRGPGSMYGAGKQVGGSDDERATHGAA